MTTLEVIGCYTFLNNTLHMKKLIIFFFFVKLQNYYRWDPRDFGAIRRIVFDYCSRSVRNRVYHWRSVAIQKIPAFFDNPDYNLLRPHVPPCYSQQVWNQLCDQWEQERWKKLSEVGSHAKHIADSSGLVPKHTMGSIPGEMHWDRMVPTWTFHTL